MACLAACNRSLTAACTGAEPEEEGELLPDEVVETCGVSLPLSNWWQGL